MKNNIIKGVKILLIALIALLGMRYFIIYSKMNTMSSNGQIFSQLQSLNEEIKFYLSRGVNFVNYDEINEKIKKFYTQIELLKESKSKIILGVEAKFSNFTSLKEAFDKEVFIIEQFNSTNTRALLLFKRSQDAFLNANSAIKYSAFNAHLTLLDEYAPQIISDLTNQLLEFTNSTKSYSDEEYLLVASSYLEALNQINSLNIDFKNINLNEILTAFQSGFLDYVAEANFELKNILLLIFAIVLTLILFEYKAANNIKKEKFRAECFNQIISNSFSSVIVTDLGANIIYVNEIFEQTSGYSFEELKGQSPRILKSNLHSEEFYKGIFDKIVKGEIWRCDELISKKKSGEILYEKVVILPIIDENKKIKNYAAIKFDIGQEREILQTLREKNAEITEHAYVDKLTGCGNLIAINELIHQNINGTIIYININNFSNLRYFYKTDIINRILVNFAHTLCLCMDTYKIAAKLYRLQLDEFCMWYVGEDAQIVAKQISGYFKDKAFYIQTNKNKQLIPPIDITIGISSKSDLPSNDRLYQAIFAHHEARSKDEQVALYNQNNELEKIYNKNQLITNMIQYALANNKVIVECQGIYDITKKTIDNKFTLYSYEILVRIVDENGAIHYPNEFLEIAKHTSLYISVTKAVIERAFALLEEFSHTKFSLNLSSLDIANEKIRELFLSKLIISSNPQNLCVEILESEGIDSYDEMIPFISEIKKYGCKISIDDFGSGYSNYFRILELNVNSIKIDGSIIKRVTKDKNAVAVVETILGFAKKQGYEVIAEHVSEPEVYEKIKELGIQYVQGYLFAKPVAPAYLE